MSESIYNSTQLHVLQSLDEDRQWFYENVLKFDHRNQNWFIDFGDFKADE